MTPRENGSSGGMGSGGVTRVCAGAAAAGEDPGGILERSTGEPADGALAPGVAVRGAGRTIPGASAAAAGAGRAVAGAGATRAGRTSGPGAGGAMAGAEVRASLVARAGFGSGGGRHSTRAVRSAPSAVRAGGAIRDSGGDGGGLSASPPSTASGAKDSVALSVASSSSMTCCMECGRSLALLASMCITNAPSSGGICRVGTSSGTGCVCARLKSK